MTDTRSSVSTTLRPTLLFCQGAGDDAETWCCDGLTPSLFWAHADTLLAARSDDEVCDLVNALVSERRSEAGPALACQSVPQARDPDASCASATPPLFPDCILVARPCDASPQAALRPCLILPGRAIVEAFHGTGIFVCAAAAEPPSPSAEPGGFEPGARLVSSPIDPAVFHVVVLSASPAADHVYSPALGGRATHVCVPRETKTAGLRRAWQTEVLPAVQHAVRSWQQHLYSGGGALPCGSRGGGPFLVFATDTVGLEPHVAVAAAVAALQACGRDSDLRRLPPLPQAPDVEVSESRSAVPGASLPAPPPCPRYSESGWPALCKADVRACVALAQMPLRVGGVPRALLQELNVWLFPPAAAAAGYGKLPP